MPAARKEDGVVMVEFALVLSLLLLLAFGMLDFGILLNAKINETQLASSGARYAAVNQNPGDTISLQEYIKSRADTGDLRTNAKVCVEYPEGIDSGTSGLVGDPVRVTMSYDHDLIGFLTAKLAGSPASLTVNGEATMRLEAIPSNIAEGCTA
jgi:Flp pilus assembly protein TadG